MSPVSVSWKSLEARHPSTSEHTSTQILASNTVLRQKKPEFLGEMTDSKTGIEKVQYEPVAFCSTKK